MPKTITLLLNENVDSLGIVGDVVSVKPGYARNFLLPRGLGSPPTPTAIKRLEKRRAEVQKEMAALRQAQEAMIEKLADFELSMERSANDQGVLFGGVSQHDIATALQAEGFAIEDRHVRIGTQIKRLDSYQIPITLANDLKTEIKLWIVSDRPLEDDEDQDGEEGDVEASAEGEGEADAQAAEASDDAEKADA